MLLSHQSHRGAGSTPMDKAMTAMIRTSADEPKKKKKKKKADQ